MKFNKLLYPIIVSTCLLFSFNAWAANHYIRDGATGTTCSDWAANACDKLPSQLVRGDVYYVAYGSYPTYTINTSSAPISGTSKIRILKATEDDHGTDNGWQAEYAKSPATFDELKILDTKYIEINGQTGGGPFSWKSGFGFYIYADPGTGINLTNASNIEIRHFDIKGHGDDADKYTNDCINISGTSSNVTVSYAYLHDAGRTLIFNRASNSIFEYIYFGHFESVSAQHAEALSMWKVLYDPDPNVQVLNTTFRYNVISHMEGTGGLIVAGNGLYVYGNLFMQHPQFSDGETGNGMISTWTKYSLINVKIYNNVFVNVQKSIGFPNTSSSGNEVKNNIFYNSSTSTFENVSQFDHNLYINSNVQVTPDSSSKIVNNSPDPFVDWKNGDVRLSSSNFVAINQGTNAGTAYNRDPAGSTRGEDGYWDIGAYEYSDSILPPPESTPPPTGTDVTPPTISNLQPAGLVGCSSSIVLMASTDEGATCRADLSKAYYEDMLIQMTTNTQEGGTDHSTTISGLECSKSYTYYVRCKDSSGNTTSATALLFTTNNTEAPENLTVVNNN